MCAARDSSKAKESLSFLSSAKLALQGVLTKSGDFALTTCPEVEQLIKEMNAERELLLTTIETLKS